MQVIITLEVPAWHPTLTLSECEGIGKACKPAETDGTVRHSLTAPMLTLIGRSRDLITTFNELHRGRKGCSDQAVRCDAFLARLLR